MKRAEFKHKRTGGGYAVVSRVMVSALLPLHDNATVGIRKTDHGHIAVTGDSILGITCTAVVQAEQPLEDGTHCVLYRSIDETKPAYWLRSVAEFTDGRFEPLNAYAAAMMPVSYHMFR